MRMRGWSPALLAGAIAGAMLQVRQPWLWSWPVYAALCAVAGVLAWGTVRLRHARLRSLALAVSAALAVFALTGLRATHHATQALDPALEGKDILVTGLIVAMPQPIDTGVRLRLEVESAEHAGRPVRLPALVDLGWYRGLPGEEADPAVSLRQPLPVHAGERWRMVVRLKAPHGARNPHGFDHELWLWEQGVRATGYVRAGPRDTPPERLGSTWNYPVEQARQAVRDAIMVRLAPDLTDERAVRRAGVVAALVTGDQRAIDRWNPTNDS